MAFLRACLELVRREPIGRGVDDGTLRFDLEPETWVTPVLQMAMQVGQGAAGSGSWMNGSAADTPSNVGQLPDFI